ncbi:MAG TPA: N-6 DNA methylase [Methylotenera sp.]|nr:N-6 DNA methylase [Methylotenera sp.]HPV45539.1 N-6 DNA methylase [Methylotenera sp.]
MNIQQYIGIVNQRFQAGNATEHSYRGDLQQLLYTLLPDVDITNEPKRIECGAPDYIISRKGKDIPIGYIEAKDVGVELGSKLHKEQFDRYKAALDNLIITDYLQFHFYRQGLLVASCEIGELSSGKVSANPHKFDEFTNLIKDFALVITQSIKSPSKLAGMMAAKARLMANVIYQALQEDDKVEANSELQGQREAFKTILIHDIDNAQFADIYAQTIAYGLFAARYHDPTLPTFSREEAATLIPKSNPFLRRLFQTVAGYTLDDSVGNRMLWIVEELVQVFLAADVAKIMQSFGKATRQQDPIVHFYETFLAEYDPKLRKARGVWYTPEPVVNFIVRAVDDILKTRFNLPQGLADTSKITREIESIEPGSKGKTVKKKKEFHRVQILDPAAGTGTFLAKTVEHIYENNFVDKKGVWPSYVREHLIPRLNGFELLMTSYAMAHLKLDMLLTETGYKTDQTSERLRIYLTNSLEEHHPDTGTLFASWLSSEANEANHIKRDAPVMVVMGNPPYSVSSSNKSDWIQDLLKDYKKDLNERNIQPLSDDYIKFIRFGQHFIDKNGEGVLAYISNNSFIDGLIHRQMRKNLLESFDEIYILDLHGNAKKKEIAPDGSKDENVFDIMQGVSINLFVKTGKKAKNALGKVFHYELHGKREAKYDAMNDSGLKTLPWQEITYKAPKYLFIQKDAKVEQVYIQGFSINDLFPVNSSGIKTHRDHFVIDIDIEKLSKRIQRFYDLSVNDDEIRSEMDLKDSPDFQISLVRKLKAYDANSIKTVTYRPFDNQAIYYDTSLIDRNRYKVMRHMLAGENLGLITARSNKPQTCDHFFITNCMSEIKSGESTVLSALFPLYTYPDSTDLLAETTRTPNLNMQIVNTIAQGLGLTFTPEKTDAANTFAPIYLLDYIYAVLHSPSYRETYKEFLKIDFPRVPYPKDAATFWQLVNLGGELRKTHLLEACHESRMDIGLQGSVVKYPISGSNVIGKLKYEAGKVYINETQYFENVPTLAWNFYIGGYQPAQKWLKDRKGRALSFEDIAHYQNIIAALTKTHALMQAIDKINIV